MSEEGTGIRVGADQNPTQAQVQALFDYCPERGLLTNRFTRSRLSRLGDQAGWFTKAGRQVSVNGKSYPVKKIIWLYVTGEFPTGGYIINKNNNKQDDRIDNLEFFEGRKQLSSLRIQTYLPKKKLGSTSTTTPALDE